MWPQVAPSVWPPALLLVVVCAWVGKEFPDTEEWEENRVQETLLDQQLCSRESRSLSWVSSLKTKIIPAGRVALDDWLACCRVSIFTSYGVRELGWYRWVGLMATIAIGLSQFWKWPWYRSPHLWFWYKILHLGIGLHISRPHCIMMKSESIHCSVMSDSSQYHGL